MQSHSLDPNPHPNYRSKSEPNPDRHPYQDPDPHADPAPDPHLQPLPQPHLQPLPHHTQTQNQTETQTLAHLRLGQSFCTWPCAHIPYTCSLPVPKRKPNPTEAESPQCQLNPKKRAKTIDNQVVHWAKVKQSMTKGNPKYLLKAER